MTTEAALFLAWVVGVIDVGKHPCSLEPNEQVAGLVSCQPGRLASQYLAHEGSDLREDNFSSKLEQPKYTYFHGGERCNHRLSMCGDAASIKHKSPVSKARHTSPGPE